MNRRFIVATAGLGIGALGVGATLASAPAMASAAHGHDHHRARHVLLLSVDGLHQSDLADTSPSIPTRRWPRSSRAGPTTPTRRRRSRPTRSRAWSPS